MKWRTVTSVIGMTVVTLLSFFSSVSDLEADAISIGASGTVAASISPAGLSGSAARETPLGLFDEAVSFSTEVFNGLNRTDAHALASQTSTVRPDGFEGQLTTRVGVFVVSSNDRNHSPALAVGSASSSFLVHFELSQPQRYELLINSEIYAPRGGRVSAIYSFQGPGVENLLGQGGYSAFDGYEDAPGRNWTFSGILEPGPYNFSVNQDAHDSEFDGEWVCLCKFRSHAASVPDSGSTLLFSGCAAIALCAAGAVKRFSKILARSMASCRCS